MFVAGNRPGPRNIHSILIGYYKHRKLMYTANVWDGFTLVTKYLLISALFPEMALSEPLD